jgi:hypothetical protein
MRAAVRAPLDCGNVDVRYLLEDRFAKIRGFGRERSRPQSDWPTPYERSRVLGTQLVRPEISRSSPARPVDTQAS